MAPSQFCDPCQVVVVMICYEEEEVHGAHGRFETWVKGKFEYRLFVNGFQHDYGLCSYFSES